MKKIVVVNASPRIGFNTYNLLMASSDGIKEEGGEVLFFNLYKLDKYFGCYSCFGCKRKPNEGKCVIKDGLKEVLDAIRDADGLIIGSPNYLGDTSAAFRALFERLEFQSLSYNLSKPRYEFNRIPVLFLMTSNAKLDYYDKLGYSDMINKYKNAFEDAVGNTKIFIADDTLQVRNYDLYNWTMFNKENKIKHHNDVFENELKEMYSLGKEIVRKGW